MWHTVCHVRLTVDDRKEADEMRRDDRGITLIEMIIAIAVTAIVLGASTLFIRNALKDYGLAEDAVDLQIEAQVLAEQFAAWVMEGNYVDAVKDADGNDAYFIIYHIPREVPAEWDNIVSPKFDKSELTGERWMRIFWCDAGGKLNMQRVEEGSVPDPTKEMSIEDVKSLLENPSLLTGPSMLSKYVKEFTVTINEGDTDSAGDADDEDGSDDESGADGVGDGNPPYKVAVTFLMKAGIQEYEFTDEVNIRNATYKSWSSSEWEEKEPEVP